MTATLFDYNGVLVDDETVHLAAFRDVLSPLGIELSDEEYWEKYLGFDDREAFSHLLESAQQSVDPALIDELIARKKPHYLERAERDLRVFPGAAELVGLRAARGPVVIVSGALRDEIELGLEVLGVGTSIAGIVSAEDTSRSKPHPEGYERGLSLLRELGVEAPESGVVFEDSLDGIRAAKAAGLYCVGIGHSYAEDRLKTAGADAVVARIRDVKQQLPTLVDTA